MTWFGVDKVRSVVLTHVIACKCHRKIDRQIMSDRISITFVCMFLRKK